VLSGVQLAQVVLLPSCGKTYFDTQKTPAWKSIVSPFLPTRYGIRTTTGADGMEKIKVDTNYLVVSLAQLETG
jgi:hypothetical protein